MIESNVVPPLAGNINFNAQHSPIGAFMSFTCGHVGSGGGIGVEIGRPKNQNIYIGAKRGDRRAANPIRCLPFVRGIASVKAPAEAHYSVEHAPAAAPTGDIEYYSSDQIRRHFGWASDSWVTDDFTFSVYTPFGSIPQPGVDDDAAVRASLLPAIVATLTVDNRSGTEIKTAVFALDFPEAGTRILRDGDALAAGPARLGFAWRRSMGVLGTLEDASHKPADGLYALQRWSVAEGISDVNPVHELGSCGGLAFEVPAGACKTLVLAIGVYLDGVVTTGLEGKYFYTRYYASLEQVLTAALERSSELRQRAAKLDATLIASGLSSDQQFQIAHGTRGYYGSTQLLDVAGEPFWIVNEGEYCMMNTLDLAIDHAFWELEHNPWVVENLLTNFARHYSYHDQVKSRGGELLPGGISFCHDMGVNNNFSRAGNSSYELAHLGGCFSYMTQEQLCNWVLLAACYVARTNDAEWLRENSHLIRACADSMRNRANLRCGIMSFDSARCGREGQEITTYDSLDESLGQARANSYLAAKCWATWIGLEMLSRMSEQSDGEKLLSAETNLADSIARYLVANIGPDGTLPAVLEKDNPGFKSRILPAIEALIYPSYWLACINGRCDSDEAEIIQLLSTSLSGALVEALRKHTLCLLTDPQRRNLFSDGGIKLSSTSNNSWVSKIALFQHVARNVLNLHSDPRIAQIFRQADAAHVRWQTEGSAFWACSDQFVSGVAKGSRYYPRIITAALWMEEREAPASTLQVSISEHVRSRSRTTQTTPAAK